MKNKNLHPWLSLEHDRAHSRSVRAHPIPEKTYNMNCAGGRFSTLGTSAWGLNLSLLRGISALASLSFHSNQQQPMRALKEGYQMPLSFVTLRIATTSAPSTGRLRHLAGKREKRHYHAPNSPLELVKLPPKNPVSAPDPPPLKKTPI